MCPSLRLQKVALLDAMLDIAFAFSLHVTPGTAFIHCMIKPSRICVFKQGNDCLTQFYLCLDILMKFLDNVLKRDTRERPCL